MSMAGTILAPMAAFAEENTAATSVTSDAKTRCLEKIEKKTGELEKRRVEETSKRESRKAELDQKFYERTSDRDAKLSKAREEWDKN